MWWGREPLLHEVSGLGMIGVGGGSAGTGFIGGIGVDVDPWLAELCFQEPTESA